MTTSHLAFMTVSHIMRKIITKFMKHHKLDHTDSMYFIRMFSIYK